MARKKTVFRSCFNPLKLKNHVITKKNELTKIHLEWLKRLNIPITPTSSKYLICGSCRLNVWRMPKVENQTGHNDSVNIANTDTGKTQPTTKNDQGVPLASKLSQATAMPYVLLEDFTRLRSKDDCRSSETGVVNDAVNIVQTCSNPMCSENHDQCSTHNVRLVTTDAADQCTGGDTSECHSCQMECTKCHEAEKPVQAPAPRKIRALTPVSESQSVSTNHELTASRSTDENLNEIAESSDLASPKPPTDVKRKYSSAEKKRTGLPAKSVKTVRFEQDLGEGYIEVVNKDHRRLVEVVETMYSEKDGKYTEHRKHRLNYTFKGHVAPVLTPFNNDSTRSLNLSIIPQYAEYLASRGISAVLVCGSLGEGPSLTVDERKSVVEAWAKAVKTTKQHLMIQIGGGPLTNVLELTRHAESIGADSVLCLPDLYFSPTKPKQLIDYLQLVGQAAPKTPLLYYHVPMFTGVNISMVEFLEAAKDKLPTLVGMKYTSPNIAEALQVYDFNNKEFSIFLGSDQAMASAFAMGMDSAIASTLNMLPELAVKILESSKSGDTAVARKAQEKLSDFVYAVIKHGDWVPTMKAAMGLVSPFDMGPTRSPLDTVSAETVSAMRQGLKALGFKLQR